MPDVVDEAVAWMIDDPDPETKSELRAVIDAANRGDEAAVADLDDRFAGFLEFGTAGLRGALGAGPNRMNRAVVIRTAAGLADYLHTSGQPTNGEQHRVVIGYDARHGSHTFAIDTAAVMTAAGLQALVMPRMLPTPVLAFALRYLDADAGVMVTASHNPPQDNGYKVYLGRADGGAQIIPPTDAQIAAHIQRVTAVREVARATDGWATIREDVIDAYLIAAASLARPDGPRDVRIVLTSLHGVGGATVVDALTRAGFTDVHLVTEQADPDPDFSTVAFPNPEEAGAMDLALTLAADVNADVVIANDPDADRCAVALPSGEGEGNGNPWRILRGDDVGALLGEHLASRNRRGVFANSIVSSRLLARIAASYDLGHAETLTGFKWIARVPGLGYGYEEALGYCVDPESVRDKDGIAAAVLVAQLVAQVKAAGRTVWDLLDDLARRHGVYLTDQVAVQVTDTSLIDDAMRRLREDPPRTLGGSVVTAVHDLRDGSDDLPATDALRYLAADQSRVIVRPSGTEPKLKCYLEVIVDVADDDVAAARAVAQARMGTLRHDVEAMLGLSEASGA
jgi:phosphomannomutase